jgi:hypothetical protein
MPQTAPTLTSFIQSDPSLTSASTVHYTLTFSEPVTGVDASDFTLTTSGVTGANIASVDPVAGSNGTQYAVTVNTGSGTGTITKLPSGLPVPLRRRDSTKMLSRRRRELNFSF